MIRSDGAAADARRTAASESPGFSAKAPHARRRGVNGGGAAGVPAFICSDERGAAVHFDPWSHEPGLDAECLEPRTYAADEQRGGLRPGEVEAERERVADKRDIGARREIDDPTGDWAGHSGARIEKRDRQRLNDVRTRTQLLTGRGAWVQRGGERGFNVVFIKMIRRVSLLRDPRVFESWLFTLSRNTALDSLRRQRCQPVTVNDESAVLSVSDNSSTQAVNEIMKALEQVMVRLRPKDQQLMTLIVQGHSYGVVAERLGISVGAVKIRMHHVRPLLRSRVSEAIGARMPSTKKWPTSSRGCLAA